jgi:hypothetical protein
MRLWVSPFDYGYTQTRGLSRHPVAPRIDTPTLQPPTTGTSPVAAGAPE